MINAVRGLTYTCVFALTACTVGPTEMDYEAALAPAGARCIAVLQDNRWTGELLAVRADGVLLLIESPEGPEVTTLRFADADRLDCGRVSRVERLAIPSRPSRAKHASLREISRFPQQVSETVLEDLLRMYGQESIRTLPSAE